MMNEQSGIAPHSAGLTPFRQGRVPSTGLRDLVVAPAGAPAVQGQRHVSIGEIWRVILKWWWLIAGIILACVLAAFAISSLIQPVYRATTTLEVNREGVQPVQMGELQPMQIQDREFLNTQAGLLQSRQLAERVARTLNLANDPSVISADLPPASREKAAAGLVAGSMKVEPVRDSRLLRLSIEHTSPELAARIANSFTENFIRSSLERRFENNRYAREFLEQRLAQTRRRLEDSERQLVAYARQQGIVTTNVDSGTGSNGRTEQPIDAASLEAVNSALQQARTERITAEQRFRQAQVNRNTTEVLANPTVQTLTSQRAELQGQYQEKLGVFQPDYPQMVQLRARIQALDNAISQETRNVSGSLRSELAAAQARENALAQRFESLKSGLLNLRQRSIQYTILQREVDTNRALYDTLLQRYREVGVAGGVGQNVISVVDQADVPGSPFKPNLPLNILLGLGAGLVLGFGAAFALEWMDDTIKTPEDVTSKLGLAPLGIIPAAAKGDNPTESLDDSRSQLSEAYQSVRTALQFSTAHGVPKTLSICSTRAGEGKSTSALSIARSIATLNARVLLIDADLRKPTFRAPGKSNGLSSFLAGSDSLEELIHPTNFENLYLLPAGKVPPNPAELLAGDRLPMLLERLQEQFDHIVIDGPPVLGLADAPLLASRCEGTLMVCEAGAIRRVAALSAVNRLRSVDSEMLGCILTKFSATRSGYGYGYGYGYGDDRYAYREGDEPKKQIQLVKES
jgi:capsular exopolysaccharide synthesis family protein